MTTLFAYGRASTDKQQITLKSQEEILTNYFRLRRSMDKTISWGGWFPDAAQTSTVPFLERPMGSKIFLKANYGDLLVVSNFDRAFRSVIDCDNALRCCLEKGIRIIILDLDVNTETPLGRAFVKLVAVLKELEREEISRRIKDAIQYNIRHVNPHSSFVPVGWKNKNKQYVPYREERNMARRVVEMYHSGGTMRGISKELQKHKTKINKRSCDLNQVNHMYVACVCGFPKIFVKDLPRSTQLLSYLALNDGRPPQLGPEQVASRRFYTLPPMPDPLPVVVPPALYEHLKPTAYHDKKREEIRIAQARLNSDVSSCRLPEHHQPLKPKQQGRWVDQDLPHNISPE
jgi:DNA invertase Pin-like site-specific DNA recombinase